MSKRVRSRLWLLCAPALLLGTAWLMRSHLPRPTSAADAWLWEQGEKTHKLILKPALGTKGSEHMGLTDEVGIRKLVTVTDRTTIRSIFRALSCARSWSPGDHVFDLHSGYHEELNFDMGSERGKASELLLFASRKNVYLVRFLGGVKEPDMCPLRSESATQVFKLLHSAAKRAKRRDPQVHLEVFEAGN